MPRASIVIPVRNDPVRLRKLLDSFSPQDWEHEVLVVADHSSDDTPEIAARYPLKVIEADDASRGPAAARNLGARTAREDVLVFIDSDVVLAPGAIERMLRWLDDPEIAGVSTLASSEPENPGFVPRYCALNERALLSRWLARESARADSAPDRVWYLSTRCGAIRKEVFEAVGGFDPGFEVPSVEETEFSFRMSRRFRLLLDLSVGYDHHWPQTVWGWLRRVFRNARLLMRLSLDGRMEPGTVLPLDEQIGRLAAGLAVVLLPVAVFWPPAALVAAGCLLFSLLTDRELLGTFRRQEGLGFALRATGVHYMGTLAGLLGALVAFGDAPREAKLARGTNDG